MTIDQKLERDVAALGDLPRDELVALWEKTYGCRPPKGIKRGLLERFAAWHLQARRLGGHSRSVRKMLRQAARPASGGMNASDGDGAAGGGGTEPDGRTKASELDAAHSLKPALRPGMRLVREWNGRMHAVDVTEEGFLFDGRVYRSLSAIAKRITGAHWSGPRFFGVRA
jgi:hypothetical protein